MYTKNRRAEWNRAKQSSNQEVFEWRIDFQYHELEDDVIPEEIIIASLFPDAVIFLESALIHYIYTDRMPTSWQITEK